MFIVHPQVEEYILELLDIDDPVVKEMEKYAEEKDFPIIGRQGGFFLYLITKIKNPRLVVEVGSGFGYSAYWFAKGLKSGKVVMTDYREDNLELAKKFLDRAGLLDRIEMKAGDGIEIAKDYADIDILFLDLEKAKYMDAIKLLENNLSNDGIIIADNVLFQGKVVFEKDNKKARILDSFNRYIHQKYDATILPVRDGLLVATRKS